MGITLLKLVLGFHVLTHGQPYKAVFVLGCGAEPLPIYMDKGMTIPMANPVISDRNGDASFFVAYAKCLAIREERID